MLTCMATFAPGKNTFAAETRSCAVVYRKDMCEATRVEEFARGIAYYLWIAHWRIGIYTIFVN